jgi:hypothetical protein
MLAKEMQRAVLCIWSLALAFPVHVLAEKFKSSQGFSLDAPAGWTVASKEQRQQLVDSVKEHLDKVKQFDLDRMVVVMFDPGNPQNNINVVVTPGRVPIDDANAPEQYSSSLRDGFRQMGFSPEGLKVDRRTFGKHRALFAEYENDYGPAGGGPGKVHQWQAIFPGSRKSFAVTCTAPSAQQATMVPLCTRTLESLDIEAGVFDNISPWMRNALIGAVIGGLVSLLLGLAKRKRSKQAPPLSPPPPPGAWQG